MSAYTTTSITLKGRHGSSTTYTTTGTTTYSVGKTAGSYSDLANGENVSLVLTSTTTQTVTSVTIYPEVFVGTVTGFDSTTGVISITGVHGTALTVDVTGTTTYTSGGAASSTAALVMGAKIIAVGLPGTAADSLNATSVNIWAPRVQTHVRGNVSAYTTTSITLKGRHGSSTTYTTTGTTTYSVGKTAGSYSDLANGENVSLVLTSTTTQTVTSVTIYPEVFVGTVTGFDSTTGVISITGVHGTALTVDVTGTTTYTSGGAASSTAALVMGAKIIAVGLPGTAADSLNATSVNIWAPRVQTHVRGNVSAYTTTSITLKGRHGSSTTYTTTGTTTYSVGKTAGSYSDLANGENVSLVLTSTTTQTVTSVTIYPEVFVGTVTGFDSTTGVISITGVHGTALTVDVTGTTTYTSGGAASSTAALVMGAKIIAVGLPGTAADSLNATSVNILTSTGGGHGHSHGHSQGSGQGFSQNHGKFGHSRR